MVERVAPSQIPAPPPGFVMDPMPGQPQVPPPPPGYVLDPMPQAEQPVAQAAEEGPSMLGGLARAAAAGIGEGAAGLVGLPAAAQGGMDAAGEWMARQILGEEAAGQVAQAHEDYALPLPSAAGLVEEAKLNTGINASHGRFYDPRNAAERYTQTATSFLPGAPMMGGVLPAVGAGLMMEGGGDAAAGIGGEKWRPVGQIAGAVLSPGRGAFRRPGLQVKDPAALKQGASAAIDAVKPIALSTGQTALLRRGIQQTLRSADYDPRVHKQVKQVMSILDDFKMTSGKNMTMGDVVKVKKLFGNMKGMPNEFGQQQMAYAAVDKIDDAIAGLKGGKELQKANKAYFNARKAEDLQETLAAVTENTGRMSGTDTAVRDVFRRMQRKIRGKSKASKRYAGTFSPAEKRIIALGATPKKYSWQWIGDQIRQNVTPSRTLTAGGLGAAGVASYTTGDPSYALWTALAVGLGRGGAKIASTAADRRLRQFATSTGMATQPPRSLMNRAQPAIRGGIAASRQEQ